jgi:cytoskeletal protein CcmA (bactofilin family)
MIPSLRRMRDQSSAKTTLINEGCKISGEITGDGNFMVNGEIVGDCNVSGTITLATSGLWQGSIRAANVVIAGKIEGDITATGKVEITDTARISGTVTAEAIAVAEGAIIEGVIKTTGQAAPLAFTEKRDA